MYEHVVNVLRERGFPVISMNSKNVSVWSGKGQEIIKVEIDLHGVKTIYEIIRRVEKALNDMYLK